MSKHYEIHTSGGAVLYVTHATCHSVDQLGTLTLQGPGYTMVGQFTNPQGWLCTEVGAPRTADPLPITPPLPGDDIPF